MLGTIAKRFGTGTGGLGNKRTNGDHPNYSIIKIGQNTEKSPGDCHPNSSKKKKKKKKKKSVNAMVKNSQKSKIIIMIKSHTRFDIAQKRNGISFNSIPKYCHKNQLCQSKN